jgi:hypothetical protein
MGGGTERKTARTPACRVFATISSCSGSLLTTMSSALVAIEPGATPLTRTLGAQSAASNRVMWASAALAVP